MINPNLFTATITISGGSEEWALHKFPDKQIYLCKRHRCGDWQALRKANERDTEWFGKYGVPVGPAA